MNKSKIHKFSIRDLKEEDLLKIYQYIPQEYNDIENLITENIKKKILMENTFPKNSITKLTNFHSRIGYIIIKFKSNKDNRSYFCNGTIIGYNLKKSCIMILTNAHHFLHYSSNNESREIAINAWFILNKENCFAIHEIQIYPGFEENTKTKNIALLHIFTNNLKL